MNYELYLIYQIIWRRIYDERNIRGLSASALEKLREEE